MTVAYNWASDVLLSHFRGLGRPTVSVPIGDERRDWFALLYDRESDSIAGVQIEDFLAFFAKQRPTALDFLRVGELRGITRDEAERLLRERADGAYKTELVGQLLAGLVGFAAD